MNTRRLGRSDIEISPIGLGCWQFSEGSGLVGGYWPALEPTVVYDIVGVSLQGGINWFDTAEAYGGGKSERALARALRAHELESGQVVVATKWLPRPPRTAASIRATIDDRLAYLGGYAIDLHQIHNHVGSLSTHRQQMQAMADLVDQGKIRSVGVSNFGARAMRRCHGFLAERGIPLVANQVSYSLFDRRIERAGVLQAAQEMGVTIIAYSPLAQGVLTGRFHRDPDAIGRLNVARRARLRMLGVEATRPTVEALERIGAAHGASPAQVALNWLCTFHGDTVVAIPGATKVSQAASNAGAMQFELTPAQLDELDGLTRRFL